MSTVERRKKIISVLDVASQAVSASDLARDLRVSRQVIVGDIALLRAQGHDILSTPRGYIINSGQPAKGVSFKIACSHGEELAGEEIYAIVDNGGELVDVIVEHPVYGQLTGQLNISSRYDADIFLNKVRDGKAVLLCNLTEGIHLHTIFCKDETAADRIKKILGRMNISLSETET